MRKKTIIVIGGAHGGPNAVMQARQFNEHARIIMIEQAPLIVCSQSSLIHQLLSDTQEEYRKELLLQEELFKMRYSVECLKDTEVIAIDIDSKNLLLSSAGNRERLSFDTLIFAGGASCKKLDVPNLHGPRVVNFRTSQDVLAIKDAIKAGAKKALVVGCGFYGVDAALALKKAGLKVSIIENKLRIMPKYSFQFAQEMLKQVRNLDIRVSLNSSIKEVSPNGNDGFFITLSNGEVINTDLVVVCVGLKPRTELLQNVGAGLDQEGLIRVDDNMATTLPDIFACGSAVSVPYAVINKNKWIPHPAMVQRTAQIAGKNASVDNCDKWDKVQSFCGALAVKIGDITFSRTGLSEEEAREFFINDEIFVTTTFGADDECVKLIVNKSYNEIVGGEVFGVKDVLRRIDLLSVAVTKKWSPKELIDIDMAFLSDSVVNPEPLKEAALRANAAVLDDNPIMSAEQFALWIKEQKDFLLIDVGESPLFSSGIQKKTIHIPLESLRERVADLSDSGPIILYSKSGYRSYLAQQALTQRGVKEVYHLDSGASSFFVT